jgi:hypothetical protein
MDAGEDLPERGLARPVFADQRMTLAALDGEADAVEGGHAAERLGEGANLKRRPPSRLASAVRP